MIRHTQPVYRDRSSVSSQFRLLSNYSGPYYQYFITATFLTLTGPSRMWRSQLLKTADYNEKLLQSKVAHNTEKRQ